MASLLTVVSLFVGSLGLLLNVHPLRAFNKLVFDKGGRLH